MARGGAVNDCGGQRLLCPMIKVMARQAIGIWAPTSRLNGFGDGAQVLAVVAQLVRYQLDGKCVSAGCSPTETGR